MDKWTKAAQARKLIIDQQEVQASDMQLLLNKIAKIPPGQLKKVLNDEIVAIFNKYGVTFD